MILTEAHGKTDTGLFTWTRPQISNCKCHINLLMKTKFVEYIILVDVEVIGLQKMMKWISLCMVTQAVTAFQICVHYSTTSHAKLQAEDNGMNKLAPGQC